MNVMGDWVDVMGDSVRSTTSVVGVVLGVVSGWEVARASPISNFGIARAAMLGSWVIGGLRIGTLAASAEAPVAAGVMVVGGSGIEAAALGTFFFFFLMMG